MWWLHIKHADRRLTATTASAVSQAIEEQILPRLGRLALEQTHVMSAGSLL